MRHTDPVKFRDDAVHHYAPLTAPEKDRLIVALLPNGWSLRTIAKEPGTSKSGVADAPARTPQGRAARGRRAL